MKLARLFSRIVLLSLAAAEFAGLTAVYGGSAQLEVPDPSWKARRAHRAAWPESRQLLSGTGEFIGEAIAVILYAAMGRIVLRLRLSPVSASEGKLIGLNLRSR